MGCCGSKEYAVEEPGAYEARRERMLQAAEERNAAAASRGIHNPRAAQKLREHQSAPQRDSYQSRRDAQMVSDWNSRAPRDAAATRVEAPPTNPSAARRRV